MIKCWWGSGFQTDFDLIFQRSRAKIKANGLTLHDYIIYNIHRLSLPVIDGVIHNMWDLLGRGLHSPCPFTDLSLQPVSSDRSHKCTWRTAGREQRLLMEALPLKLCERWACWEATSSSDWAAGCSLSTTTGARRCCERWHVTACRTLMCRGRQRQ